MSGAGSSQKRKADAPAKTQTKGRVMSGGSAAGNIRAERRDEPPSSAVPETAPDPISQPPLVADSSSDPIDITDNGTAGSATADAELVGSKRKRRMEFDEQ